ncbi:MAG: FtsW/RodA/SpoVE family cell cycle protein [Chloroflexota bacterium]
MTETISGLTATLIPDQRQAAASVGFRERLLLFIAGLFLLISYSGLIMAQNRNMMNYWPVAVWAICAVAGHIILRRTLPRRDPFLFPVMMLLAGWGLALIDRLAPPFAIRQTAWLVISVAALLVIATSPGNLRWLSRYRYLWLTGGLVLLTLTIILGTNPSGGGPRLWLSILGLYFQPSELLKVLLVVFLASYLADNRVLLKLDKPRFGPLHLPPMRFLSPLLLMWGVCIVVLVWQQDLGTATLFFLVFLAMLYVASGQIGYVLAGALMLILAGALAYQFFGVVRLRFNVWIDPWPQSGNQSFQIVQSLLAFSAGGVFGQGIAQGSPTYIPVVHSDFIFAAIAEEWGLIGTLVVTACLALLILRGMRLAARTQSRPFRSFLAAGISITLAIQSLLIMMGVLKIIPLTGITLPFLSYGGSSLLTYFLMVGLLIVLSGEA